MSLKNIIFIRNKIFIYSGTILLIFTLISLFLKTYTDIFSALIGYGFGVLIFNNLIKTLQTIKDTMNKNKYLPQYITRIFIYTAPIIIGLYFKEYFKKIIILIFLFLNQIILLIFEILRSIKTIRRKK